MFFDDILVYSPNEESNVDRLKVVLETLREHHLYANLKKCEFGKEQVAYLGHVISKEGVAMDYEKVKAMMEWSLPKNLRELRGFLGLTRLLSKICSQLCTNSPAPNRPDQLKKDNFQWSEEATQAFEALKLAMVSVPVLAMPDFSQEFVVEADASGYGLRAVLLIATLWGQELGSNLYTRKN